MNIVLLVEPHAAVRLNPTIAIAARGLTRIHFGGANRRCRVRSILLKSPRGIISRRPRALRFQIHVGAMVLHCLEHSYRLAELLSAFVVFDGGCERSLHSPLPPRSPPLRAHTTHLPHHHP